MRWGRKVNQVYDEGATSVAAFRLSFYEEYHMTVNLTVAVHKNFTPWSEIMLAYMREGLCRCPTSGGNAQSTAAPLFSQAFVCVAGLTGWRT